MDANQMTEILDTVFRTLYENMDKGGLLFEEELLRPNKIALTQSETERLWDILRSTGFAGSIVGFGNEGKLEITPAGIQMMMRYGSYKNFLASQNIGQGPQQVTIQLGDSAPKERQAPVSQGKTPQKPKKAARSSKQSPLE